MPCCFNVQICMLELVIQIQKVNHDLATQLSIIITGILTQNCACNAMNISKMATKVDLSIPECSMLYSQ